MIRLRVIVSILLLSCAAAGTLHAQHNTALQTLRKSIDNELKSKALKGVTVAIEISEIESGDVLYTRNGDAPLRPASSAKLFTSAAALLALPTDFTFRTQAFVSVGKEGSTVFLRGAGDPLLYDQDIEKLVDCISASRIPPIQEIAFDRSLFDTSGYNDYWSREDESYAYFPWISPFIIDGNVLEGKAYFADTLRLELTPPSSLYTFERLPKSRRPADERILRLPGTHRIQIHGPIPRGDTVWGETSIWRSEEVFADIFLQQLRADSLIKGNIAPRYGVVGTWTAPLCAIEHSLDSVLTRMNKQSDNLCAEVVLKTLSALSATPPAAGGSWKHGCETVLSTLRKNGIELASVSLWDGSGLSIRNRASVAAFGSLLRAMAKTPHFGRYVRSMAVGGIDGTLKKRLRDVEGGRYVHAKTGTLQGTSALTGYVLPPNGKALAFSILVQDFSGAHTPYRRIQDAILRHCLQYAERGKR